MNSKTSGKGINGSVLTVEMLSEVKKLALECSNKPFIMMDCYYTQQQKDDLLTWSAGTEVEQRVNKQFQALQKGRDE